MHLKALLLALVTFISPLTLGAPLQVNSPGKDMRAVKSLYPRRSLPADTTADSDGPQVAAVTIMTLEGEAEVERPDELGGLGR
ncbi:hypothetical protein V8F06_004979 [Rhypophila decipiens]